MSNKSIPPTITSKSRGIPKPPITKREPTQTKHVVSLEDIPYPQKEPNVSPKLQKGFIKEVLVKNNRYPPISVDEIAKYWALPLKNAFNTKVPPPDTSRLRSLADYIGLEEPMNIYEGIALIITYYYGEDGKGFLLSFKRALNWAKVLVDLSGEKPVVSSTDNTKFRFSFFISLIKKIEEIISSENKIGF